MVQRSRVGLGVASTCALVFALAACKGDRGPEGPPGPPGSSATGAEGGTGVTPGGAALAPPRLYAKITSASIPNGAGKGGAPTLTYRLFHDAAFTQDAGTCAGGGSSGFAAITPNFTAAKLVDDPWTPGTKTWQSYINVLIGTTKVGAVEGSRGKIAGTLKDNGDGSCTYTYKSDLSQPTAPSTTAAVTEQYDPAAVTRLGMQNAPAATDPQNPTFDGWADVAAGGGAIQPGNAREIVETSACNQCHFDLSHHGGRRHSTEYCVSCHNPGTPDPNAKSQNSTTLSFGVMIHEIHQGSNLPAVTGTSVNGTAIPGATKGKIVINGTDYTFVGFPQDTGNCTVCHAATSGTGSDYWKNQPSIEACGACHDRVDFSASAPGTTGGTAPKTGFIAHPAGAVQDGQCAACHADGKQVPVTSFHNIGIPTAAQQKANYKIVSISSTKPGNNPTVTFAVTNPASGAGFDLATDPLWNAGGNSRLFLDLGWTVKPGEDWTNTGSGATTGFGSAVANGSPAPGQPVQIDLLAGAKASPPTVTKNADGTYTVTSTTAIPSNAVGSGVAVLEGHPGTTVQTFAVTTATQFFPITDATAQPRRTVVDIQKCDKCHGMLNLHGNNRNDNIDACVVCHNTEATDVTQRGSGPGIDGKTEQAIDFAVLVHGIHAGQQDPATTGIVVYPFTGKAGGAGPGTPVDFREVQFPEGNSVGRCVVCHADSNPYPSADMGIVNGVTITSADAADQATYLRTTRIAAVCSSCHQGADATAHMAQMGAAGVATVGTAAINGDGLTQSQIDSATNSPGLGTETCTICHGRNAAFDPIKFHGR